MGNPSWADLGFPGVCAPVLPVPVATGVGGNSCVVADFPPSLPPAPIHPADLCPTSPRSESLFSLGSVSMPPSPFLHCSKDDSSVVTYGCGSRSPGSLGGLRYDSSSSTASTTVLNQVSSFSTESV